MKLVGAVAQAAGFSGSVSGLTPNTLYYYRCFVTNAYGGAWSGITNFTTPYITTTYIGPNGRFDRNYWNNPAYWDNGIPTGLMNARIPDGVVASAYNDPSTPTYVGDLTIGVGATVLCGSHAASINAIGTAGSTTLGQSNCP